MRKACLAALASLAVLSFASSAYGHVTVQPPEAIVGSFSRFVVRVPNEDPKKATIKVEVEFPPLAFVSFEPKDGWKRTVEQTTFDEPLDVEGNQVKTGVGKVTWSGGEIGVGEFLEFGFSARMPDTEEALTFRAIQTYEGGKVVEWVGEPDSAEPAPLLNVYDIGAAEGEGPLAVIASMQDSGGMTHEMPAPKEEEDDDTSLPLILSVVAVVLSGVALMAALSSKKASVA